MTTTSSSDRSEARVSMVRTLRRSRYRLAVTLGVAALAATGPTLVPEQTGALFTAEASTVVTGFRVGPMCDVADVPNAQSILDGLGPTLHWGFSPDAEPVPWVSIGDPVAVAPDGTLACDDGVLGLAPGQAVWVQQPLGPTSTVVLVMASPVAPGTLVSLVADDGGADVVVSGSSVTVRAWSSTEPTAGVATASLGSGAVHVLALTVDGADVSLWVDGDSGSGTLPASLVGPLGSEGLGLGTLAAAPGEVAVPTATFTATELAVVSAAVPTSTLEALAEAAIPGLP